MSEQKSKSVVIIGSGIIGLTSAYELCKIYKKVYVVDQREDVCLGASFQNGGVVNVESISPVNSYMNPWKTIKASAFSYLTGKPTNSMIRPSAILEPNFFLWLKHFFMNSSKEQILYHSEGMRQMGAAITPLMEELFQVTGFDRKAHNFHYTPGLLLSSVGNPAEFIQKKRNMFDEIFAKQYITEDQLVAVKNESGIQGLEHFNYGCIEPHNITVNTRKLGKSLKEYLIENGVEFVFNKNAKLIPNSTRDEIKCLQIGDTQIQSDHYVVAAGYGSNEILNDIGLKIPLMPIKAYSLHISNPKAAKTWKYACHIDDEVAGLFTPYRDHDENAIRVTGIRDLDGSNPIERPERIEHLKSVARKFIGQDLASVDVKIWAGIMPLSPDDFPVIGQTKKFSNLYINAGHGFRGTAYSLPSARLLVQIIKGNDVTCFDRKFADPSRFHL